MPITPNMVLTLPVPTITIGPLWARQLNAALTLVDSHDHSPGKGVKITPAGLNINTDLSFQSHNANFLRASRYDDQTATLGLVDDIRCLYVFAGDLWYNNGSGTPVQVTIGSVVNAATTVNVNQFENVIINANTTILPSDTFSFLEVLTSLGAFTVTLPLASAVAAGRFYEVKDIDGNANVNVITITPQGGDTIDTHTGNYIMGCTNASQRFVTDGSSKWYAQNYIQGSEGAIQDSILVADSAGTNQLRSTNVTIDGSDNMDGANITTSNFFFANNRVDIIGGGGQPGFEAKNNATIYLRESSGGGLRPVVTSADPATNGLMIVRGGVNAAGTKVSGEGFTSSKLGTGRYQINFTSAFLDTSHAWAVSQNAGYGVRIFNNNTNGFEVDFTETNTLALHDSQFLFIAIGQRTS